MGRIVLVLLGCGLAELLMQTTPHHNRTAPVLPPAFAIATTAIGGTSALALVAFKVGAFPTGAGSSSSHSCNTTPSTPTT